MDKLANPAPLGLMGFGMTTVLLNIHNAGFFPMSAMILAMGLCYGGIAQIIAGVLEFKRGNTFGLTAMPMETSKSHAVPLSESPGAVAGIGALPTSIAAHIRPGAVGSAARDE